MIGKNNKEELSKFHRIYQLYKNTMYSVAYDIIKNSHDAEDIVADSTVKIISKLKDIDSKEIDGSRCKNLVITITKYTAIDYYRKKAKLPTPCEYIEEQYTEKTTEDLYLDLDSYQKVIDCIDEMDEKYRDVLRLKALYHLSSKEIGELLNITEKHVNVRFGRAKEILAKKLEEHNKNE